MTARLSDCGTIAARKRASRDTLIVALADHARCLGPSLPSASWQSGIVIDLDAAEWVDITSPAALIPPAHIAAAELERGRK
ncbi:hypothetical protein ACFOM8_02185 [Paracoccus angustae]|uniref:Uncharacterized protein n=1 Tax=Paracoccus angustae TaxID=1671480 RepID=A0ABV7TZV7_9RHOB